MRALTRHGYSTRTEDLYGPYAAKRLPRRLVSLPNLGTFADHRSAAAASLTMARGFLRALARPCAFPEARAVWISHARNHLATAAAHTAIARRLP